MHAPGRCTLPSAAPFASSPPQWVAAADAGTARAATGTTKWFADPTHNGTFATSASTFDASTALQLSTPASSDGTYSGSNVDFQIELFFTPTDSACGPDPANGVNKCTAAGAAYPSMCYTVIKWEPLATSPAAWSTVDLSSNAALTATTGGGKNTNEIGIYPKPGPLIGNTLSEYLAQMSSYQVLAVGVSLGSGAAASVGYVKTMTYASQTYNFQSEPLVAPQIVSPPSDKGTVGARWHDGAVRHHYRRCDQDARHHGCGCRFGSRSGRSAARKFRHPDGHFASTTPRLVRQIRDSDGEGRVTLPVVGEPASVKLDWALDKRDI